MSHSILSALPNGFAKDFKPELRLIAQLLQFAKKIGRGSKELISETTGIPTGVQTGKVEPTIYYAVGMGLIVAEKRDFIWDLNLTPLGDVVLAEDPYLSEPVSLWIMHLMLCRPNISGADYTGIADPWYALFVLGETRLRNEFSAEHYWQFLKERYGESTYLRGMANLILRSYEEHSCLGITQALRTVQNAQGNIFVRNSAPHHRNFFPVYTIFLFKIWDDFFPNNNQISLTELFGKSLMLNVLNWSRDEAQDWLNWIADHGVIQFDRQTGGTLALRTSTTLAVIKNLYSELI